jgi:Carboxypeptidase regulatory-like domain
MNTYGRWTLCPLFSIVALLALSLPSPARAQAPNASQNPAQSQQPANGQSGQHPDQHSEQESLGNISGTVIDQTGAVVTAAHVTLTLGDQSPSQETMSGGDGQFLFANVVPGPFRVTITSVGFGVQTTSGILHSGENYVAPQIVLVVANDVTIVRVVLPRKEVAEAQLKQQEKQRVLGVVPNFYVTYIPDAAPLSSKQKFELGWKSTFDPVNFAIIGGIAGIQQATDTFSGYGQGAQGYGKRYGANFADLVAGTFIASAILPSLLKQDPRYFYKGTGTKKSRMLYALANAVICKGDNGHWQPNYSNILGNIAAGGISNLYYPSEDRNGVELTFENALVGIGATAAANVLQEFLIRKLTPHISTKPVTPLESSSAPFIHMGA